MHALTWRWPVLTLCVMAVNVAAYLWMVHTLGEWGPFSPQQLIEVGGNVAVLTVMGDWWRLPASLWLHASGWHLFQNLVFLLLVGSALESLLGRWQWLLIYLLSGLFAAWMSALWHFDTTQMSLLGTVNRIVIVGVGASGAVMGLAGAQIVVALVHRSGALDLDIGRWVLLRNTVAVVALTVINGLFNKGVDNVAHVAGFMAGFAFGVAIAVTTVSGRKWSGSLAAATVLLIGGFMAWLGHVNVTSHPDASAIHREFVREQDQRRAEQAHETLLTTESTQWPAPVLPEQARGVIISERFVTRIVPTGDDHRVHLLHNYDEARLIEYDLDRHEAVRTWLVQPYAPGDVWGCPSGHDQCAGVGLTDLALDEPAGVAFASSLVKGEVTRLDLDSGAQRWSVATGAFPSRLLLSDDGRVVVVFDQAESAVTVLDADTGEVRAVHLIPTEHPDQSTRSRMRWPWAETMVQEGDGRLYLRVAGNAVFALDLREGVSEQVAGARHCQDHADPLPGRSRSELCAPLSMQIGRDATNRVWLLHGDGVTLPGTGQPRQQIRYEVERFNQGLQPPAPTYMRLPDTGGLILHIVQGYVFGSSAQTGQVLRVWPLAHAPDTLLTLSVLDDRRFYVSGREGAQVFRIDQGVAADPVAIEYQRILDGGRWQ